MDDSNGYENVAREFIKIRGNLSNLIGVEAVEFWAKALTTDSKILDIGCGNGIPISKTLIDCELQVYGIDASQTLATQFKENFPNHNICCETVQNSKFYNLQFDAVIAWGLMFLLSSTEQMTLIAKISKHLKIGGKLLFTSPSQKVKWKDVLTGVPSESLGSKKYYEELEKNGIKVLEEFQDEGQNHYYSCVKTL